LPAALGSLSNGAGPERNRFKPMWSDQWLSYMFKTRDKPDYLNAMDFENWRKV